MDQPDVLSTQLQVNVDPSDLPGDGSESDPYEIANASELQAMEDDLDANYELVSDIDASNRRNSIMEVGLTRSEDLFSTRMPLLHSVGQLTEMVTQLLDSIDRPSEADVGLLGYDEGIFTDVTLTDVTFSDRNSVSGLIGINNADGMIRSATPSGSVTATGEVFGGLGLAHMCSLIT
ncbi:hypothetical protein [Haloquadratum walsbyi]|uniref:Uncharacterized protein n=1 Tax=Haloquadratum walsbyi J07HQW2 TaxID=1238425 RepID=U1NA61_9EURY|nr:hypothetical protein [Haloquadratum walsbyi]ERG93715.1 MAG: hypothetical protein J07HQW2_00148 [Haloquadratum walsbyi J07HQW2]